MEGYLKDKSLIEWQTGKPKEDGLYLVTLKGKDKNIVCQDTFIGGQWCESNEYVVVAHCMIKNIEPFNLPQ